jgi:hypothetical protein
MIDLRKCPGRLATMIAVAALWAGAAAAAEDTPDALLTTPVTPEILAQGAEADAYAQGVQAYVWGWRPFYLVLRLYQPRGEVLKGEYQLPEVVQDK